MTQHFPDDENHVGEAAKVLPPNSTDDPEATSKEVAPDNQPDPGGFKRFPGRRSIIPIAGEVDLKTDTTEVFYSPANLPVTTINPPNKSKKIQKRNKPTNLP